MPLNIDGLLLRVLLYTIKEEAVNGTKHLIMVFKTLVTI